MIDECLHTSLVEVAIMRGHQATHVTWRGLAGAADWTLMGPIRSGEFTFVTNNAKDFRRLYAREANHMGLVYWFRRRRHIVSAPFSTLLWTTSIGSRR